MDKEPAKTPKRRRRAISPLAALRNNFLTGLVVVLPLGLTLWLVWTLIGWVDGLVLPVVQPFVPAIFSFDGQIGAHMRGVGLVIFVIFTVLAGWIAKGLIGRSLIGLTESIFSRMPIVRTIYFGAKQIAENVFSQSERKFEKACLIEYPRKGIWAIGLISTSTRGEVVAKAGGGEMVSVFVPTTPNPTSGFLLFFPREDVIELDMSIEDAAKLVISAGLVYPNRAKPENASAEPAADGASKLPEPGAE